VISEFLDIPYHTLFFSGYNTVDLNFALFRSKSEAGYFNILIALLFLLYFQSSSSDFLVHINGALNSIAESGKYLKTFKVSPLSIIVSSASS
jgi:hypothetical protein